MLRGIEQGKEAGGAQQFQFPPGHLAGLVARGRVRTQGLGHPERVVSQSMTGGWSETRERLVMGASSGPCAPPGPYQAGWMVPLNFSTMKSFTGCER